MKRTFAICMSMIVVLMLGASPAYAGLSTSDVLVGDHGLWLSEVKTEAGNGNFIYENGDYKNAAFRSPMGIAISSDGSIFIADTRNHLIRLMAKGQVSTYAGIDILIDEDSRQPVGALHDDTALNAVFNEPTGIAIGSNDELVIADSKNHAIRKITADREVITIAGDGVLGHVNGAGNEARFYNPSDVAIADDGTIYVADTLNHVIRRIAPNGQVTTLNAESERTIEVLDGVVYAAGDYADGPISQAKFNEPSGLAIDSFGNLYVSDSGNHLIRYIDFQAGTVSTIAGIVPSGAMYGPNDLYAEGGFVDGEARSSAFRFPKGLALTDDGALLIADSMNHAIRLLANDQVMTIAGNPEGLEGRLDGIETHNQLHYPSALAIRSDGEVFIADTYNNQVRVLKAMQLSALPTTDEISILFNGNPVNMDVFPEIANDRTMVPVRAISEAFDYTVTFLNDDHTVELSKDGITVQLTIGETEMSVIDEEGVAQSKVLDVAPYVRDGRTFVPLRFFSEEFSLDVKWVAEHRAVILRTVDR